MALRYHLEEFENEHELNQFDTVLRNLRDYFNQRKETAYLLGGVLMNGADLDAILLTRKAFIGVEFKDYARRGCSVVATENSWEVFDELGKPKMKEDGVTPLTVAGGKGSKNPVKQAKINRSAIIETLKKSKDSKDSERYDRYVPWVLVFNQELNIKNELPDGVLRWLTVTTNNNFVGEIDKILTGMGHDEIVSDAEITSLLVKIGINTTNDANNWKKPPFKKREKEPEKIELPLAMHEYYTRLAERGEMIFLALLSVVMSLMMMFDWKWQSQSDWMNIGAVGVVAFVSWLLSVNSYTRRTRKVLKKRWVGRPGEFVGLNKFSILHVAFCHFCWLSLAAVLYFLVPVMVDKLPSDMFAILYMLKKSCYLIQVAALVIAVLTSASLVYRLYEMYTDTRDESSLFSRYFLTMMPCARCDVSKSELSIYSRDLRKWTIAIFRKAFFIVFAWIVLTFFFDEALFLTNFRYWPFNSSAAVESIKSGVEDWATSMYNGAVGLFSKKGDKNSHSQKQEPTKAQQQKDPIQKPPKHVNVSRIYFKEGNGGRLKVGEHKQLHLVVEPSNHDEKIVCSWARDVQERNIISVSDDYQVSGLLPGESLIIVTTSRTKQSAEFLIHVEDNQVEHIIMRSN